MYKGLMGLAIVLAAATAGALLPEDPVAGDARGVKGAALSAMTTRAPAPAQVRAAGRLADTDVQWDLKTGAPLSVRGAWLGTRSLGGKGPSAAGKGNYAQDTIAVLDSLADVYAARNAPGEFSVFRVDADRMGFHHARVRQMYKGLRVVGGELIVHFNGEQQAYQVNGRYLPGITLAITPTITPAAAVAGARADLVARGKPSGALTRGPELVVFADGPEPILAYELVLVYPAGPGRIPGRWVYTVDALAGTIADAFNSVSSGAATISGNRLAGEGGGSVSVTGTSEGGAYYLKSGRWLVYNADMTGSFPDSRGDARRHTADWGTSDRVEMSGAWNFSAVQDYFSTVHGRDGFDGAGARAIANVHQDYGSEYNNAYWESYTQEFYFYDGDGIEMSDLAVTDVAAHEFTHAVDECTADLTYRNESGALNESFSDIFGALVEFHCQPDGRSFYPGTRAGCADWLIAEDCMLSATALRDMRDPSSAVTLEAGEQQPSKYHGTYWYTGAGDNGGVHVNNGVQNFFFYLLCEGGSGSNDGTNYNVAGIGIDNAGRVAYRALAAYCTAGTDYAGARTAWISAAADLNSNWVGAVQDAWAAAGVPAGSQPAARYVPLLDDFDGDRYGDPSLYDAATGTWQCRLSRYGYALAGLATYGGGVSSYRPLSGSWDSDGNSDPTIYDSASGYWYMALSTDGYNWYFLYSPADSSYLPVCADFDGDRYADPTVYSQSGGCWYILASLYGWELPYYYTLAWAAPAGYLPFGGDFDGDGRADPAFYGPDSYCWYILLSSWGYRNYYTLAFGAPGYTAALGDFDGDFRVDPVMRNTEGHWYVLLSGAGYQGYCDFTW